MFFPKFKSIKKELPLEEPKKDKVKKTKDKTTEENKKISKINNNSKVNFEFSKEAKPKNKQPEHLRKALEKRKKEKAEKIYESDSDSDKSLDLNDFIDKKNKNKIIIDSESDSD